MSDYIILTLEGKKKLEEELKELKTVKRKEITEKIELAKEHGDLSENAEYHEAREEQAFAEGRILEIEHILKNGVLAESNKNGKVQVGSKVSLEVGGKILKFTIVGSHEGDPSLGFLSCDSPIGQAILGKAAGETVTVETPRGDLFYKIKTIS
ncbi:MAG: transcription elongation factor GreA [Candidatus Komeilibacteria bacterium]|nr:transcription elongation factor GreA [Candidatus Komeilibacteria bacterium]